MKIFMVFVALLLVFTVSFTFAADINRYSEMQKSLKYMAEECACGAALMTDAQMASYGYIEIDEEAAEKYCTDICNTLAQRQSCFSGGTVSISKVTIGKQYAAVGLTYTQSASIFRLPWLDVKSLSREAEYIWE